MKMPNLIEGRIERPSLPDARPVMH